MKNRASVFLKQIISVITSLVKEKSMAIKTKTSALKTRIIIYSLLRNKKVLMTSITHKFNSFIAQLHHHHHHHHKHTAAGAAAAVDHEDQSRAIVPYINKALILESHPNQSRYELAPEEEEEEYPDLTHTLFDTHDQYIGGDVDDDEGLEDEYKYESGGSVVDLVRNSKEDGGEKFRLEDEIDHVADLFIRRFHREMRMQKQESFKRYQEMLQRSV